MKRPVSTPSERPPPMSRSINRARSHEPHADAMLRLSAVRTAAQRRREWSSAGAVLKRRLRLLQALPNSTQDKAALRRWSVVLLVLRARKTFKAALDRRLQQRLRWRRHRWIEARRTPEEIRARAVGRLYAFRAELLNRTRGRLLKRAMAPLRIRLWLNRQIPVWRERFYDPDRGAFLDLGRRRFEDRSRVGRAV